MSQAEILELVQEIEHVHASQFWWDSPLLARAATVHDPRPIHALAIRHHGLGNKKAFSAHVLRQTIKLADGPQLKLLWAGIDSESDSRAITEKMEDFFYLPWAAAFIIGEIGGAPAFAEAVRRLAPAHSARHFLIIRLLSHVVVRYLTIREEPDPQTTIIDLETGNAETLLSRYADRPAFDMASRARSEANELFTRLPPADIAQAQRAVEMLPDSLLNYPKDDYLNALATLRARCA